MAAVKYDGDTVMKGVISDASEQQTDADIGALSAGSWVTFEMVWWPTSTSEQTLDFYRDGVFGGQVGDSMTDYGSATDMQIGVSVKNGGANAETLYVRALEVAQYV